MNELNFQTLVVEGIEQKENRIVVKSAGLSFSFFKLKKDGTESRAFQDFTKLNVQVGQTYSFGVSESQGEYDGKPITYRNIAVISESRGDTTNQPNMQRTYPEPQNVSVNPPQTQSTQPYQQTPENTPARQNESLSEFKEQININFKTLTNKIQDLEKRIEGIETYIHQEKANGKEGLELHQSFDASKNGALKDTDIPVIGTEEEVDDMDNVPF